MSIGLFFQRQICLLVSQLSTAGAPLISYVLLLFQCFKVIPGLAFALFAVLDGLFGAIADARHTVGAVFAPDRLSVFQTDVVQRAQLHALTAADAGIRCAEGIGFYKEAIKHRVYRAAHKAVVEVVSRRGKFLPGSELGQHLLKRRLCLLHDALCLLIPGCIEHGNVVFRHDDLGRAHILQLLLRCKLPVIACRIANFAAAVHHKPDALCPGQRGLPQPPRHHPGDAPCVGRRDQHHIPTSLHRGGIPCLDAGVQVVKRHFQPFGDAPRQIPAVAGSRKIKYHGCSLVFCVVFGCLSARQTGTCRGEAPPSCCRKTVRSLESPTGAFIVPLRSTNANLVCAL